MGRNVSSGGGGDLEARLHPQEVSWWAWAAEVVGVLLVEGATKGAWRKRGKIGGVTWGLQLTGCFLSACEVPPGGSEIVLGEACRDLIIGAGS